MPNQSYVIGNHPPNEMIIFLNLEDCLKFMIQNFENYFGFKLENDTDYQSKSIIFYQSKSIIFDLSFLSKKINQYKKITLPCPKNNENIYSLLNGGYFGYSDAPYFYVDKITQFYGHY